MGAGNLLAFFTLPGLDLGPYREVLGGHHHLAISVTREKWDYLRAKLDDAGIDYHLESKVSLYFPGPRRRAPRAAGRPARRDVRHEGPLSRAERLV